MWAGYVFRSARRLHDNHEGSLHVGLLPSGTGQYHDLGMPLVPSSPLGPMLKAALQHMFSGDIGDVDPPYLFTSLPFTSWHPLGVQKDA